MDRQVNPIGGNRRQVTLPAHDQVFDPMPDVLEVRFETRAVGFVREKENRCHGKGREGLMVPYGSDFGSQIRACEKLCQAVS